MLNVFFVLLLFLVALRADLEPPAGVHEITLPPWDYDPSTEFEEVTISITKEGLVQLNGTLVDSRDSKALPELTTTLTALKKTTATIGDELLVVIQADELTHFERIVDVFDAMARAEIGQKFHLLVGDSE